MDLKSSLTKGTVPLLILEILRSGEAYGYEIVKEIARRSGGRLEFGQGTVYPLLYKLQRRGFLSSERKPTESGKDRRYYCITEDGLEYLERSKKTWRETNQAIGQVLGTEPAGATAT
ncbi:MAG: PadR family transcriptional regulator [bacterium]